MIKAIPGVKFVEMSSNREKAHCCGSVLTFLKEPEIDDVVPLVTSPMIDHLRGKK